MKNENSGKTASNATAVDGNILREQYMTEALLFIAKCGYCSIHELSIVLFHRREQTAAISATRRVIANLKKENLAYVRKLDNEPGLIGITKDGLDFLKIRGWNGRLSTTDKAETAQRYKHKLACNEVVAHAIASGAIETKSEYELYLNRDFYQRRLSKIPDVLTTFEYNEFIFSQIHEIDYSHRSQDAMRELIKLIKICKEEPYLQNNNLISHVVIHCFTKEAKRTVMFDLKKACNDRNADYHENEVSSYTIRRQNAEALIVQVIERNKSQLWKSELLPFADSYTGKPEWL